MDPKSRTEYIKANAPVKASDIEIEWTVLYLECYELMHGELPDERENEEMAEMLHRYLESRKARGLDDTT